MTRAVIVAGEGEYRSHETMLSVRADLERELGLQVSYVTPDVLEDMPLFPRSELAGIEALDDADLLVIYTRWRQLPDEQMRHLARYLARGGPVVGLRTATHAFHFDEASPWASWNDGFGRDVLGTPWVRHHGHSSRTTVSRLPGIEHPVLDGVADQFEVASWLYYPHLAGGCHLLLHGDPVSPEIEPAPGPVAWTREHAGGGRVVYTSLGHPDDFAVPSFRRLLVNAAAWCVSPAEA